MLTQNDYTKIFAESAKRNTKRTGYRTFEEWEEEGVRRLKNRILKSPLKRKTRKSIEELSKTLTELDILTSSEKKKDFFKGLHERSFSYGTGVIKFIYVQNSKGEEGFLIQKY